MGVVGSGGAPLERSTSRTVKRCALSSLPALKGPLLDWGLKHFCTKAMYNNLHAISCNMFEEDTVCSCIMASTVQFRTSKKC